MKRALVFSSLIVLAGCTGAPSLEALDGGLATDAAVPSDGATRDAPRANGGRCRVDEDCPGDPRLVRRCLGGLCADLGCNGESARCDDGSPCTIDACEPTLECSHRPNGICCTTVADCDDGNACTTDRCEADACAHELVLPCGPCLDHDGDGATPTYCGGTDCNDGDPSVNPSATEICDDERDDDCDDRIDADDLDCQPATATCEGRERLSSGVAVQGSVLSAHFHAETCGSSALYEIPLATESDVAVHLTLDASTPVEGSGFDARGVDLALLLETTCGDASTSLVAAPTICDTYPTAFSTSRERDLFVRRVPAGAVFPEVQERLVVAGDPTLRFTIEASVRAAQRPACDAAPVGLDGVTHFGAPTNDGLDCFGPWVGIPTARGPERIHAFTLDEPARVVVTATPTDASTTRVAILASCDTTLARATCEESSVVCESFGTIERNLEAGTHYAVVEASAAYDLVVHAEPIGDACAGASSLVLDGAPVTGDSTGAPDRFHYTGSAYYDRVCGSATGPDVVLAFTLTSEQDVELSATTSYRALLRLLTECGGDTAWSSSDGSMLRHLVPGTYYVVLDGADPTQYGTYSVSLTTG